MRKKNIIYILLGLVFGAVAVSLIVYYKNKENRKSEFSDILDIVQPIYGAFAWADLCDDNGIPYSKESLDKVKKLYLELTERIDKEKSRVVNGYLYAVCIDQFINNPDRTFLDMLNADYDDQQYLYGDHRLKYSYVDSVQLTGSYAQLFYKYDIQGVRETYNGLLNFLNRYLEGEFPEEKDEAIVLLYILWNYNKASDIDLKNEKIVSLFQEKKDMMLRNAKSGKNMAQSSFTRNSFLPLWNACGIDTSELEKYLDTANVDTDKFYMSEYWLEPTLFSGWFLPDLYFDVLHGGNDYYSGNERFVKEFGEGLNRYLDDILIPTMERKTKELFK